MRESCSCGAAIHTMGYRRVLTWRLTHRCEHPSILTELDSETSLAIGFQPNEPEDDDEEEE